jgi:glucose-1-phosphate adenylyltransferase
VAPNGPPSPSLRDSLVMILAGGEGQRLYPLTRTRAKPAVRFGGAYRIIDFTLSNCLNSGLRRIYLMTQYAATSLQRHLRTAWSPMLTEELGEFIEMLPPQRLFADRWYAGTADAVFQNLMVLQEERPPFVFLLSGDHIYKQNYADLLCAHEASGAVLTVACVPRPRGEARQFGVMQVDEAGRVTGFQEKPADPAPMPGNPDYALVSMGVYLWHTETLVRRVAANATQSGSHDFGKDIIPAMVAAGEPVYAYFFQDATGAPSYWRDIGTLDSYWETTLDLVAPLPQLDLYDPAWPVYGSRRRRPPAKIVSGEHLAVEDSLLAPGCIISGASVKRSVLSPGAVVEEGAQVHESIVMDEVVIGAGAQVRRALLDEGVRVPPGYQIGLDPRRDRRRFVVTDSGVVVVPFGAMLD